MYIYVYLHLLNWFLLLQYIWSKQEIVRSFSSPPRSNLAWNDGKMRKNGQPEKEVSEIPRKHSGLNYVYIYMCVYIYIVYKYIYI